MDDSPERKHDQITVAPIGNHCDDMNPDIIPAKYGKFGCKNHLTTRISQKYALEK